MNIARPLLMAVYISHSQQQPSAVCRTDSLKTIACLLVAEHPLKPEAHTFHEFAGNYYEGNGRYGTSFELSPNGHFTFEISTDMVGAPKKRLSGTLLRKGEIFSIREIGQSPGLQSWERQPNELMPLLWGDRHYLIRNEVSHIIDFCNAVNAGDEPRQSEPGIVYLREGDRKKEALGKPKLPRYWMKFILAHPVTCKVTSILGNGSIKVDAGSINNLSCGMVLIDSMTNKRFSISQVERSTATAKAVFGTSYSTRIGDTLSTRYPARR
jgi:hypothetical protein